MTTAARLLAEVGIDPSDFNAGLKDVRQRLIDVAKDVDVANKAIDRTNKQLTSSNESLTKSLVTVENSADRLSTSEKSLTKAHIDAELAAHKLATAIENVLQKRGALAAETEDVAGAEYALARATEQAAIAYLQMAKAELTLENAQNSLNITQRTGYETTRRQMLITSQNAEAQEAAAQAAQVQAASQATLAAEVKAANRALFEQSQFQLAAAASSAEQALRFQAMQRSANPNPSGAMQMAVLGAMGEGAIIPQIAAYNRLQQAYETAWGTQTAIKLKNFATGVNSAAVQMRHFGTAATMGVTVPIAAVGAALFMSAVQVDKWKTTLATAMHSASKDSAEVSSAFNMLAEAAKAPGLEIESTVQTYSRMLLQNVGSQDALTIVKEFGNQLGLVNATADQTRRVFLDITKAIGTKTFNGQEFRIMAQQMPTLLEGLRAVFHTIDTKKIGEMGFSGKDVMLALAHYFQGTARAADSAQNDIKKLKQELLLMAAGIGKDLLPVFHELVPVITGFADAAEHAFESLTPETRRFVIEALAVAALVGPLSTLASAFLRLGSFGIRGIAGIIGLMSKMQYQMALVTEGWTEMEAAEIAFGTASLGVLGPIALAIGAIAVAVYGAIKADEYLRNDTSLSIKSLSLLWQEHARVANSQVANTVKVRELVDEYGELQKSHINTKDKAEQMRRIYDEIYQLNPLLTKGYDDQLKPLGLIADAHKAIAEQLERQIRAQKEQQTLASYGQPINENLQKKASLESAINFINAKGVQTPLPAGKTAADYPGNAHLYQSVMPGVDYNPNAVGGNVNTDASSGKIFIWDKSVEARQKAITALKLQIRQLDDQMSDVTKKAKDAINPKANGLTLPAELPSPYAGGLKELLNVTKESADKWKSLENSCARVTSDVLRATGFQVKWTASAAELKKQLDDAVKLGHAAIVPRGKEKPGDVVFTPGTGPSGIHASIYAGKNTLESARGSSLTNWKDATTYRPDRTDFDVDSFKEQQDSKMADAKRAVRDATREATAAEKEDQKFRELSLSTLEDVKAKHAELIREIQGGIRTTKEDTKADQLADEYRKSNIARFYELNDITSQLTLTTNKHLLAVMNSVIAEQQRNVSAQRYIDTLKRVAEMEETVANKTKKAKQEAQLATMTERQQKAIKEFGTEQDGSYTAMDTSLMAIPRVKNLYAQTQVASNQEEDAKHLQEAVKATREALMEGKDAASAYEKAIAKIAEMDEYWLENGLALPEYLKAMNDELERKAKLEDRKPYFKAFNQANRPLQNSIQEGQTWQGGKVDQKSQAVDNFKATNSEYLKLMKGSENGENFVAQANELADAFARDWDLKDKNRQIAEMNKTLFEVVHTSQMLAATDPFKKWQLSHQQYDPQKNAVTNPFSEAAQTAGVSEKSIFDVEQANLAQQKLNEMRATMLKTSAEMSAQSPFEVWKLQFEYFNEETKKWELPESMRTFANQGGLQKIFQFQQTEAMMKQFADNTADIMTSLFSQIANGAKVSWSSIGRQFEVMLFKMAQEMANSQMKQFFQSQISKAIPGMPGANGAMNTASMTQFNASLTQFSATMPTSISLFQEAVMNFSTAVAGMGGSTGAGMLPGMGSGGSSSDPLDGFALNGEGIGPFGVTRMTPKATPIYGPSSALSGAGESHISNSEATTTNNFHYHIYGRDDKTIRNTVTQSVSDLTKLQASTKKRVG